MKKLLACTLKEPAPWRPMDAALHPFQSLTSLEQLPVPLFSPKAQI